MVNHPALLALAALTVFPGRAFALEDSYLPASKIPYAVEAPDQPQRLGPLWGERAKGPAGTLLKVPGNWRAPVHAHTADYRAVVIQGRTRPICRGRAKGPARLPAPVA
ncbi:MAG: DUF4437 domain-containing protein [Mesorhizobium sp.]|nr:MAG: DUF4437 domain-containing protein [Mesorhizobium sp.]